MPLIDCFERLEASYIVNEKGANAPTEEKRSQRVELFLTKSVPDVRLNPMFSVLDINTGHGHNLADTRWRLIFLEFIKDASIGQRSLANTAIPYKDKFVVLLLWY